MGLLGEVFSGKVISQSQLGNCMGLNVSPYLRIGSSFGQRVPLLVESNIVSSGIVVMV